jgi:hypothetical protein
MDCLDVLSGHPGITRQGVTDDQLPDDAVESNLNSPERRLIDLRIEHGDLDAMIDRASAENPLDELLMRRLKKKRLGLRDEIARLERLLDPDQPA